MFNPFAPQNWVGRENPYGLLRPPVPWLRMLWDRDPELRIMPGLAYPCYRVARVSPVMRLFKPRTNDSETGRMCREMCIPVVTLRPDVTWNNDFFLWLEAGDMWAIPQVADYVEQAEQAAEDKQDAQAADTLDQMNVSAYDAMKLRSGQRVFVQAPN